MLNVKDIITLDNEKKYAVMSKANIEEDEYYYLLNPDDYTDYKFCKLDTSDFSMLEIKDAETIKILVKKFAKELRNILNTGE